MKNKNVEKEIQKELIQKFGENSILNIAENTFLILCKGEAFKIIKGKEKGSHENHDKVLNLVIHHGICGELWTYDFDGNDTLKEIDILYKGYEE